MTWRRVQEPHGRAQAKGDKQTHTHVPEEVLKGHFLSEQTTVRPAASTELVLVLVPVVRDKKLVPH